MLFDRYILLLIRVGEDASCRVWVDVESGRHVLILLIACQLSQLPSLAKNPLNPSSAFRPPPLDSLPV